MNVLLDTHAVLWAALAPAQLGQRAKAIVEDMSNVLLISAASAWEVAAKVRLGRLPGAERLEADFIGLLQGAGYQFLPIEPETALRAGRLSADHGDPFDRILAAQALARDIPIVSRDARLDIFGVRRIW